LDDLKSDNTTSFIHLAPNFYIRICFQVLCLAKVMMKLAKAGVVVEAITDKEGEHDFTS
jgi:hypothetical protein